MAAAVMRRQPVLFQFHNGSIKAKRRRVHARGATQFQFHNGSIKAIEHPDR